MEETASRSTNSSSQKRILTEEDLHKFSIVPLENCSLDQALERANFHGAKAWGVLPLKHGGWGIRVFATEFEEIVKVIRPTDYRKFSGETYEISSLPEWICEDGLAKLLRPDHTIVRIKGTKLTGHGVSQRMSYLITTTTPIVWDHKQGPGGSLVCCNIAERRRPKIKTNAPSFRPSKNNM